MKLVTATFATAALLALAGVAPGARTQAQDQNPKQQQEKPTKPPQQHPQEQRPAHPQTSRPPQEQKQTQRPERQPRQQETRQPEQQKQQQKSQEQEQRNQQKAQERQRNTQQKQQEQQRAASHARTEPNRTQRAQQAPPARGGQPERGHPQQTAHYEQAHFHRYSPQHGERVVRISDNDFRVHFGREHRFRIGTPVVVGGFSRFQYSGFWFVLEEPWPGYWAYDNADFYVMFTDGNYWLCNYDDPGVQIELAVVAG